MASQDFQLRVEDIPSNADRAYLKLFFQNAKRQGGGTVKDVALEDSGTSAVITFDDKRAVDIVLQKGETVEVRGKTCKVSRVSQKCQRSPTNKPPRPPPRAPDKNKVSYSSAQPLQREASKDVNFQTSNKNCAVVGIEINDVNTHRDIYALFLGDFQDKFDEENIFMDGLKKTVYVPFQNAEDAKTACLVDCTDHSNVRSVQIAESEEVVDHYANLISIHGMDFSQRNMMTKLKQFVSDKTKSDKEKTVPVTVSSIITGPEPRSAILVLDQTEGIYDIAWKCVAKLDGVSLFTSPVKRSKSVFVTVDKDLDKNTVRNYFKSARSDGGPVKSCDVVDDGFLVTFENIGDAVSVEKKKDHLVAGGNMTVKLWHHCLSKEAYDVYLKLPGSIGSSSQCSGKGKAGESMDSDTSEVFVHKPFVPFYALLVRTGFLDGLKCDGVRIETDPHANSITIKGNESSVKRIRNKIKVKELEFDKRKLEVERFDQKKVDFMYKQKIKVQSKINQILATEGKSAYIDMGNENNWCYLDKGTRFSEIEKIIDEALTVTEELYDDQILALTTEEGKSFVRDLIKKTEDPCKIDIMPDEGKVVIFTFEETSRKDCLSHIFFDLHNFMKYHKVESKSLAFPHLKLQYVHKFLQKELDSIVKHLKASGARVKEEADKIDITGLQSVIAQADESVSSLREKITIQDEHIHHFGIKEFLSSDEGKRICEECSEKNQCLMIPMDYSTSDGMISNSPQDRGKLIGSCDIGTVKVKFILGDITAQNVNVIINAVSKKLQCKGGMSKAIVQKGGDQIQQELDGHSGSREHGDIVITTGGRLPCSALYHLLLEKEAEPADLYGYVKDCLRTADQNDHNSVAMPLIGCGNFKIPVLGAAINIAKAVKKHAEKASKINEITICDNSPSHIKTIIDRFDDVDQICTLDIESDSGDEGSSSATGHSQRGRGKSYSSQKKRFGPVFLTIKQGDILKEDCDVIACGIRENMQLRTGGAVSKSLLRICGDPLQTECSQKVDEMQKSGVAETSSHGLGSCSALIFVNQNAFSRSWGKGVEKVLSLAEEKGHSSLAIPAFGTGAKHANIPKLKHTILDAIKRFGEKSRPKTLADVRLVVYDRDVVKTFLAEERDTKLAGHKQDSKPVPVISTSVTVRAVFHNSAMAITAMKELRKTCEDKFQEAPLAFPGIKELSEHTVKNLISEGLRRKVQVKIQKEAGTMTVASFDSTARMDMQTVLFKALYNVREDQHKEDIRSIKMAFKWQFMSKDRWRDFDQEVNFEIEKAFKNAMKSVDIQDRNQRKYRIDFQLMKEFRIRGDKLEEITTVNRFDLEAETGGKLPANWDKMDGTDSNLKIVPLSQTSQEYKNVEAYFKKCGATVTIRKIDRIQNVVLYQQYASKKRYFEQNNPKGTENEKKLFHGTDPAAIANINASGFNRSFCGKNATAYGNGVYFAEESSYSVNYARADPQGNKMMYLAAVLVGESTPSQKGFSVLPNKPGKNVPYDSGRGPKMFIIFHDCQAYPEYLITW